MVTIGGRAGSLPKARAGISAPVLSLKVLFAIVSQIMKVVSSNGRCFVFNSFRRFQILVVRSESSNS